MLLTVPFRRNGRVSYGAAGYFSRAPLADKSARPRASSGGSASALFRQAVVADLQRLTSRMVWPLAMLFVFLFGMRLWRRLKPGPAGAEDLLREEAGGAGADR